MDDILSSWNGRVLILGERLGRGVRGVEPSISPPPNAQHSRPWSTLGSRALYIAGGALADTASEPRGQSKPRPGQGPRCGAKGRAVARRGERLGAAQRAGEGAAVARPCSEPGGGIPESEHQHFHRALTWSLRSKKKPVSSAAYAANRPTPSIALLMSVPPSVGIGHGAGVCSARPHLCFQLSKLARRRQTIKGAALIRCAGRRCGGPHDPGAEQFAEL
jgi:hypothetical protein